MKDVFESTSFIHVAKQRLELKDLQQYRYKHPVIKLHPDVIHSIY